MTNTVWVRGRFVDMGKVSRAETNVGLTGTVTFTPAISVLYNTTTKTFTNISSVTATPAAADGYFAVQLQATNVPHVDPLGWHYMVSEPSGRSYTVTVPFDTPVLDSPGDPLHGQQVFDLISVVPQHSPLPGIVQLVPGVAGYTGRGITSTSVDGNRHLIVTYDDQTTADAGALPAGSIRTSSDYNNAVAPTTDQVISWSGTQYQPKTITPSTIGAVSTGSIFVNVLDYGAVGDNATDDTAACQSAFNAVASGGTLFFPPNKTFKLTNAIIKADISNVKITGGGTLRQVTTATSAIRVIGNSSNVTIDGLTLIGPHTAQAGVGSGPGIYIGGTLGATCKDIRISGCQITGFCHAGIMLYGGAGTDFAYNQNVYITRNRITDCQNGVFIYKNATSVTVSDNRIESSWYNGICFDTYSSSDTANGPSRNVTASNNIVTNTGTYGDVAIVGILFKGDHKTVSIVGNEVIDTGANTSYATPATPIGIYVNSPTGGGVGTYYPQDVTITGNVVTRGVGKTTAYHPIGIQVHYTRNFSMTSNAVSDMDYGIQALYSVNGLIQSNTVVRPSLRGLVIDGDATTKSQYIAVGNNTFRKESTAAPIAVRMDYADTIRYTPPVHDFATELSTTVNTTNFTDARTPNVHATTHASGGSDVITPASIGANIASNIQRYTTPGSYTWTKPAGCTVVYVLAIGGGSGGGSGRRGAAGTVRCGGGGGGGGGYSYRVFPASILSATETVYVGSGGTGAPAITTDSTDGQAGTNGDRSYFRSASATQQNASTAGAGGTVNSGTAGIGAVTTGGYFGSNGGIASTSGGVGGIGNGGSAGSGGGTGGGAGGGITAADVVSNGGVGGSQASIAGGNGGTSPGGSGTSGSAQNVDQPGVGGGGGASSITGAGGAGGNGVLYGGAGGGGGASLNGNASGAGGNGANGIVVVIAM